MNLLETKEGLKYFPDFTIRDHYSSIEIKCVIRILHNKKWYDVKLKTFYNYDSSNIKSELIKTIKHHIYGSYTFIILGNIDLNIKDIDGNPIYQESKIQISEEERMKLLINS